VVEEVRGGDGVSNRTVCRRPIPFYFSCHGSAASHTSPLSLHDALPIWQRNSRTRLWSAPAWRKWHGAEWRAIAKGCGSAFAWLRDRKSTRLNSSHLGISYAVFCLKKKKSADRAMRRAVRRDRRPYRPTP